MPAPRAMARNGEAVGFIGIAYDISARRQTERARCASEAGRDILREFLARAEQWNARLGIFGQQPDAFLTALRGMRASRKNIDMPRVEALLQERQAARANKDFATSDALRQALLDLGVSVRDTPEGQDWDLE